MTIFGWDLPPGCTVADIDRAFGNGEPSILEDGYACRADLADGEKELLASLTETQLGALEDALTWAFERGGDAAKAARQENAYWDQMAREYERPFRGGLGI